MSVSLHASEDLYGESLATGSEHRSVSRAQSYPEDGGDRRRRHEGSAHSAPSWHSAPSHLGGGQGPRVPPGFHQQHLGQAFQNWHPYAQQGAAYGPAPPFVHYVQQQAKLPPLWLDQISHWFDMCELAMARAGIRDSLHRLETVAAALPADIMRQHDGILRRAMQSHHPYEALRAELCTRYQLTSYQRFTKVFKGPPLGGREPIALRRLIEAQSPNIANYKDWAEKFAFMDKLPKELRAAVAEHFDSMTADELAEKAQRVWAANQADPPAKAAEAVAYAGAEEADPSDDEAPQPVAAVQPGRKGPPKKKPSPAAAAGDGAAGWKCKRHHRFGAKAYDCDDPKACEMAGQIAKRSGNGKAGGQ